MKIIKIGRSLDNDCVIQNSNVSGHHAELILDDNEQQGTIRDLNSTNGTFVNNARVSQQRVSVNDVIRLGSEITSLRDIVGRCGKTKIRVGNAGGAAGGGPVAGGESYTIGRDNDCRIKLTPTDVSHHHALLYRNAQGDVVIEDTNSTNGTYVNGERVTSRKLQKGDRVTITRAYALDWENYLQPRVPQLEVPPVAPKSSGKGVWISIAAVFIVALLGVGGYFGWKHFASWSSEKIYNEYGDAVCMTYSVYGYNIYQDDEDITTAFFSQLLGQDGIECLSVDGEGNLVPKRGEAVGTGFFVSKDGKVVTNLHITQPWLSNPSSSDDPVGKKINQQVQDILIQTGNGALCSRITVKPQLYGIGIIPDGVVFSPSNLVSCTVYKEQSGMPKDVAVIQTESRTLPAKVTHIIDFNKADLSPDALKEGKKIFTIGYPSGTDMGMIDNREIHNQVHEGNVTQNRGEVSFGHDMVTEHGASGSPILNDKGQLVGINNAGFEKQGLNMGVKAKYIVELLK